MTYALALTPAPAPILPAERQVPQFRSTWGPAMALVWIVIAFIGSVVLVLILEKSGVVNVSLPDGKADINALQPIAIPIQIAILLLAASRLRENPFEVLGFRYPGNLLKLLKMTGLFVAGVLLVGILFLIAQELLGLTSDANPNQEMVEAAVRQTSLIRSILLTAILVPIAEEVMFRGVLLQSFSQTRMGFWGAAVVTSLLFALMHVVTADPFILAPYFLVGMACAWGFRLTGSLWTAIAIHGAKNAIAVAIILS